MCTPLGMDVARGEHYVVYLMVFPVDRPDHPEGDRYLWWDGGHPTTPDTPANLPPYLTAFAGMRRVVSQPWLQPLVEIRSTDEIGNPTYVDTLRFDPVGGCELYRAEFEAARSGRLSIFVNDAVLPGNLDYFYGNNRGAAQVLVFPQSADHGAPPYCLPRAPGDGHPSPQSPARRGAG
jgi:hypothetical protein